MNFLLPPAGHGRGALRMPHGSDPAEALVCLRKRYEGGGDARQGR
jgi:hypothetical protein